MSATRLTGFRVSRAGPLALLQDAGRFQVRHLGVTQGGPADLHAWAWANHLAGNPWGSAALEVTFGGLKLVAERDLTIALTGADLGIRHNDKAAPRWRTLAISKGDILTFGTPVNGLRSYLAVAGGFCGDSVMGSASCVVREQLGGFDGQGTSLRENDALTVNPVKNRPEGRVAPVGFAGRVHLMSGLLAGPAYGAHIVRPLVPHEASVRGSLRVALFQSQSSFQDLRILGTVFFPGHRWFPSATGLLKGAQAVAHARGKDLLTVEESWVRLGHSLARANRGPVGSLILALRQIGLSWDRFHFWSGPGGDIPWDHQPWAQTAHALRAAWRLSQWRQAAERRRFDFAALSTRSVDRAASVALWASLHSDRDRGLLRMLLCGGLVAAWRRGLWVPESRGGLCPHCRTGAQPLPPREHYEHRFRCCAAWSGLHDQFWGELQQAGAHLS